MKWLTPKQICFVGTAITNDRIPSTDPLVHHDKHLRIYKFNNL